MAATQRSLYPRNRYLQPYLISKILCNLPVKSLLRFRCVSKSWLAWVDDDPNFARSHLKTFRKNCDETRLLVAKDEFEYGKSECILRCSDTFECISGTLSPVSEPGYLWRTVCSIDGLILIKSEVAHKSDQFCHLKVWNPSIMKLRDIPPLLKSEPSVMDKDMGIGYDPVAKDYKLVKLIFAYETLRSVAIYALGAGSWTIIFQGNGSTSCFDWHWEIYGVHEAVYFRSSLYFVGMDKGGDRGWDLVWFDLSKEVFSSVKMPRFSPNRHYGWNLVSVEGGSALLAIELLSSNMYVLAVDGESMCWKKLNLNCKGRINLLYLKKNGDMLMRNCWDSRMVESYSFETHERKMLGRLLDADISHVSCYVESLVLHR